MFIYPSIYEYIHTSRHAPASRAAPLLAGKRHTYMNYIYVWYMFIYLSIYIYMYMYMYTNMCVCMSVCACVYMCINIHV